MRLGVRPDPPPQARALLDANVCKRLNPQAEEALWVLDKARMTATGWGFQETGARSILQMSPLPYSYPYTIHCHCGKPDFQDSLRARSTAKR